MPDTSAIVSKVWNYAHVLKNAGVGYGDYVEQITYLLFGSGHRPPGCAQPFGLPTGLKSIGQLLELPMSAALPFSSSLNPHE